MPLDITFHLSDSDLEHFREVMTRARDAGGNRSPEEIVEHASALITKVNQSETAEFIRERMDTLDILIAMVLDRGWELEEDDRNRVVEALSYFAEAEDLIPDDIPGLGFLDDAIMIELVMRELRHEIEAYQDFCLFRNKHDSASRDKWLSSRRKKLQDRMRRRRKVSRRKKDRDSNPGIFD